MTSAFLEIRLLASLRGIHAWKWLPGHDWVAAGVVDLSYGHYINSGFAHTAFGDSEVAGLTLQWPL